MSTVCLDLFIYYSIAFSEQTDEVGIITPCLLLKLVWEKLTSPRSHTWSELYQVPLHYTLLPISFSLFGVTKEITEVFFKKLIAIVK